MNLSVTDEKSPSDNPNRNRPNKRIGKDRTIVKAVPTRPIIILKNYALRQPITINLPPTPAPILIPSTRLVPTIPVLTGP